MKKENTVKNAIKINRAKKFDNGGIVFDMEVNGVIIYNCRWVETEDGEFVAFPSTKGKDGKYYNIAYVKLTDEDTQDIKSTVMRLVNMD